ncbi:NADH-quinone oxidoreductase subunit C [Flexivirga caeni]|uniref:NADH-quinone oxidoreductase subunit C n=1 Tax=Flexivirga caeni TaxID=2294115 RepID=UPI001C65D36A|nr:NADH-quinone oxidoreductase subunit C [Flexivirga caeni]
MSPEDQETTTDAVTSGELAEVATPGKPVQVAERKGMFGSSLGNDTTGYGELDRPVLFPGAASKPYGGYFDQLTGSLEIALRRNGGDVDSAVERVVVDRGELTLFVAREHLPLVAQVLRDEPSLRFEQCLGVSGVHYPQETGRELHAVYHFISITNGSKRVRVEVTVPEGDAHIPSIVATYPGVDWHERETWDMFGIVFDGHPALTRILMPDDWPGHPQRKDYPLGGIPVEYKGATVPPADDRRSYK